MLINPPSFFRLDVGSAIVLTGIFWRVLSLLIGFDGALSINGFLVLIIVALFFWFIVNWTPFTSRRRHGRQMHLDPELNETSDLLARFDPDMLITSDHELL